MRLPNQFDSRVAQRVFSSFLLASLVPLLVFSWVAVDRIGSALEQEAYERLGDLSRNYGQITLDKLLSAADALHDYQSIATGGSTVLAEFDAVAIVENGQERVLLGDWPGTRLGVPADDDRPSVTVTRGIDGAQVVIGRHIGNASVYGRVSRDYLSRTDGLLGRNIDVCLFAESTFATAPFYCTRELPATALTVFRNHEHAVDTAEQLAYEDGGEQRLTAHWQLFLPSHFRAEPWLVVLSQERTVALQASEALTRALPQIAVATLALIVILAMRQIRRTLTPLKELLAGTRRIGAHDFSVPVTISTADEFGTLGAALNGMAGQLSHHFSVLEALADIDRLILESPELDPVLATVLARLVRLAPQARHAIVLIEPEEPLRGRLYERSENGDMHMKRIVLTPGFYELLPVARGEARATAAELAAEGVATTWSPTVSVYVTPMATAKPIPGALFTAMPDNSALPEHQHGSLAEFAARIAVAVAASSREAELFRRAHYDSLTQLPNRQLLLDRLRQAVAQAERDGHALAVLFVDLDNFKDVNDSLGHPSGDELLKETAIRLAGVLRHADTVARLGGDEYAIVLPHVQGPLEAEAVAIAAIGKLRTPFVLKGRESFVSASIGISMFPYDGTTATELLRKADIAMYSAKGAGKGYYRFFAEAMDARARARHALHADLGAALHAGDFFLTYQPQRTLANGRYLSAEALVRWRHPERGIVSPALFVPILEETGLVHEVGAWVLRRALTDWAAWHRAGLPIETVAVNVSAHQLLDPEFVNSVAAALTASGVAGQHLEIEVTEAVLIKDFHAANDVLTELRRLGVKVALDDFGTGYSSLAYLNDLVFDVIKIDQRFVVNLPTPGSVAIVRAIIAVADALGKTVVAEGVETESQLALLAALGCDAVQGYLCSRPLTHTEFIAFLQPDVTPQAQTDIGEATLRVRRLAAAD